MFVDWLTDVSAFVIGLDPTLTKIPFVSPCETYAELDPDSFVNSGRALCKLSTDRTYIGLESGATGSSSGRFRNRSIARAGAASVAHNLIANGQTSHWAAAAKFIIRSVNATGTAWIINITDETTANAYVGVNGATSTANYTLAGTDSGDPIDLGGEHTLVMWQNGTNVRAYLDLTASPIATVSFNVAPNAASRFTSVVGNGATASDVAFDLLGAAVFAA